MPFRSMNMALVKQAIPRAHAATAATRRSISSLSKTLVGCVNAHVITRGCLKVKVDRLACEVFHAQVQGETKGEVGGSPAAPCLHRTNLKGKRAPPCLTTRVVKHWRC